MLQRATSNAYSWWWASHIRTKQSKWLEQSLQDMERRVEAVLKLIQEDGDSFAKRAEMYYKKRPELIDFVEESYRAYRALASRYDHLSTELQNANHTIGTAFPDRVQFSIDDEDDYGPIKISKNASQPSKSPNPLVRDLIPSPEKQQPKKSSKPGSVNNSTAKNSGLSKSEAIEEISKLQKEALALQAVKEFVKSSYESGLNKLREIENQIRELQDRVFSLQDEFKVGNVVEYDKAWTSMAGAALKSCEEMLAQLQEKHESSAEQAKVERRRVEDAHEKLESLKHNFLPDEQVNELVKAGEKPERLKLEVDGVIREREEPEKNEALTMAELAEKIDRLVSKVIDLETEVSYQAALIDRLRKEIDDLLAQVRTLGDEKATLVDENKTLISRLREMEEKLREIQDLNQNVENKNNHLQTQLAKARRSLDHLSEKLHSVKPDEEIGYQREEELEIQDYFPRPGDVSLSSRESKAVKSADKVGKHSQTADNAFSTEPDQEQNWQEMLLNGIEDKEKVLMTEYVAILRSYKDVQKKLSHVGEKNQEVQLRELRSAVAKKDEEILSLRRRLGLVEGSFDKSKDLKDGNQPISDPNGGLEIETPPAKKEEEVRLILIDQKQSISPIEEKLRMNIDLILDENLDFWLRFSTSFHLVGKFKTRFQDLQAEITEVKRKASQAGSAAADIKSDLSPVYKHLRDIQTELTLWIEQSTHLKEELQGRFLSLCNIQEEIKKALSEGAEEEQMKFTSHEAAKLQGEVLNMKQENNKVRDELQVGLNHVTALQQEIEKTFTMLRDEYGLSESKNNNNNHQNQSHLRDSTNRTRVPLQAFIFGDKPKKKSIFSCMHHRRHHDSRGLDVQRKVS